MSENVNCLRDVACPRCGNDSLLRIVASVWLDMTDDGTVPSDEPGRGDHEWDENATTECPRCGFMGRWSQFHHGNDGADHVPIKRKADVRFEEKVCFDKRGLQVWISGEPAAWIFEDEQNQCFDTHIAKIGMDDLRLRIVFMRRVKADSWRLREGLDGAKDVEGLKRLISRYADKYGDNG